MPLLQSEIGLAEALINFTRTFSPNEPCRAVRLSRPRARRGARRRGCGGWAGDSSAGAHDRRARAQVRTDKTRKVFYQPERDVWMVLVLNKASRDGDKYGDTDLADAVLHALVRQAYDTFCLFHARFAEVVRVTVERPPPHKHLACAPRCSARMPPPERLYTTAPPLCALSDHACPPRLPLTARSPAAGGGLAAPQARAAAPAISGDNPAVPRPRARLHAPR